MRAFALPLAIVVTTGVGQAQGTATVSGLVRDEAGVPIREALVVIDPGSLSLRARTDTAGRFRIAAEYQRWDRLAGAPGNRRMAIVSGPGDGGDLYSRQFAVRIRADSRPQSSRDFRVSA
jgi:hypothetical protein